MIHPVRNPEQRPGWHRYVEFTDYLRLDRDAVINDAWAVVARVRETICHDKQIMAEEVTFHDFDL